MLKENEAQTYWAKRASQQKERTVGFSNKDMATQDKNYQIRHDFIIPKLDCSLATLDYGCGIGRYSSQFNKDKYLGVDITKELLDIAKERNPEYRYQQLDQPFISQLDFQPEMIMTTTVLQHNHDNLVKKIIRNWTHFCGETATLALYENTHKKDNAPHIAFRKADDYLNFVNCSFNVEDFQSYPHVIHGEEHTLCIFKVRNNKGPLGRFFSRFFH